MTTTTEAAKLLLEHVDERPIREGDLAAICADPALAQKFARRLVEAARQSAPGRPWTIQDLRDVFEVAVNGARGDRARLLEGRYFRKRLREQCALAERYGDVFACVVITLASEQRGEAYSSVLDAITEKLRRTDMVFLYRRRFAIILPRMRPEGLEPLISRVRQLIAVGVGEATLEKVTSLVFPHESLQDSQAVLDWAEDQLRNV